MANVSMPARIDVSVCICTFRRPEELNTLLAALQAQREGPLRLQLVVADNDPDGSAVALLSAWSSRIRFRMDRLHLPLPNIALARNACVEAAVGEWIAFVDDDEQPEMDWIARLVSAAHEYAADVVFGPVLPLLPGSTPGWLRESGMFDRPRHSTGTPATLDDARTGNALVRRSVLVGVPGPFNPAFGNSGGSDSVLFAQLAARGTKMVWCDEAIVRETIPIERVTVRWLLQRAFRNGQVRLRLGLLRIDWRMRPVAALLHAARSLPLALGWAFIAALAWPFSKVSAMGLLRKAAGQAGVVLASVGYRYQEYRP